MDVKQGEKNLKINGQILSSIIEYKFENYILYVFPGRLSEFDILIKYKKDNKKVRTPKHIHWVVDILLKMEHEKELTIKFLQEIKQVWETCKPLKDREFRTLKNLVEENKELFNLKQFDKLSNYGEYQIEFLYVLMLLLSTQEKTNRNDAYMFGQIVDELLELDLDIFKILSKAGFGGRR